MENMKKQSLFKIKIGGKHYFRTYYNYRPPSIPIWKFYDDTGFCVGRSRFKDLKPDRAWKPHSTWNFP